MPDLALRVHSFSYKRGLPDDETPHGGGFVFDMRCLPNPGRLETFKNQTGLDAAVVSWLESEPDVIRYREHVMALLEQAVSSYLERGFHYLSVGFGCTGGQHRSVYFADYVSRQFSARPRVMVSTEHLEQLRLARVAETALPGEPG